MIDTHCHIDDAQYQDDLPAFLQQQKDSGVEAILVPGVDVHSIDTVLPLCAQYPDYLYPALGLHPEEVKADWQQQWGAIRAKIEEVQCEGRLIAIGEIGLDYHWDTTYKEEQHIVFRDQLLLARRLNLPVMVHIRDAMEDTYRILHDVASFADETLQPLRGVVHCFSGSREMAEKFIALGFYLGIGGVLTFKNCKLSDTLRHIPLQHLVMETDAPYMAPVPHRGKRNESRWMTYVAERLADLYLVSTEDVKRVTTANASTLFGIK